MVSKSTTARVTYANTRMQTHRYVKRTQAQTNFTHLCLSCYIQLVSLLFHRSLYTYLACSTVLFSGSKLFTANLAIFNFLNNKNASCYCSPCLAAMVPAIALAPDTRLEIVILDGRLDVIEMKKPEKVSQIPTSERYQLKLAKVLARYIRTVPLG